MRPAVIKAGKNRKKEAQLKRKNRWRKGRWGTFV